MKSKQSQESTTDNNDEENPTTADSLNSYPLCYNQSLFWLQCNLRREIAMDITKKKLCFKNI